MMVLDMATILAAIILVVLAALVLLGASRRRDHLEN